MHFPIYFCVPSMVPPYYDELPWKTVWWGEHVDLLKQENVIELWEGWELYLNDDVGRGPPIVEVENQCPPTQKPSSCKVRPNLHQPHNQKIWPIKCPLLLATLHVAVNVICIEPKFVGMWFLEHNSFFNPL